MPYYDYHCNDCENEFEVKHGMTEVPTVECPNCHKTNCRKLFSDIVVIGSTDAGDYDDVREAKPKWLKFKDGHRERFDATKHGYGRGKQGWTRKAKKPVQNTKPAPKIKKDSI